MSPISHHIPQLETLRRISDQHRKVVYRANAILQSCPQVPSSSQDMRIAFPPVPYPSPIMGELLRAGLTFKLADLVSRSYLQRALALRRQCEDHIQRVSHVWLEGRVPGQPMTSQMDSIRTIFVSRYRENLNSIFEQVMDLVRSRLAASLPKKDRRITFNKAVTPILESFYSRDPFPSSQDKQELAQRTNLTLEQVRHWFQNRRARAKRSGQPPIRNIRSVNFVQCQPSRPSLSLETEINHFFDSELRESSFVKPNNSGSSTSVYPSVLWSLEIPEHAFPSTYPPTCKVDPFLVRDGLTNFDIPWIREGTQIQFKNDFPVPDVSSLIDCFSMLSIADDDEHSTKRRPVPYDHELYTISSMWIPAKSSLDSSVLSPVMTISSKGPLYQRRPSSRSHGREASFRPSVAKDVSPRPKPYPHSKPQSSLPKRIPQSQPRFIPHQSSSSRSQLSRSPSVSSITSDDSSSSYASSSDSELGTPPPICTDLPMTFFEKELPSSNIFPIPFSKLSQALSESPTAPRTYTFRTTIAPS